MTQEASDAFEKTKVALNQCFPLHYINPSSRQYQLVTDASGIAVGAALHQVIDCNTIPIAFFSKRLTNPQRSYSAFDRELLAAYLAVLHFKCHIDGQHVTLFSDHKPLISAFHSDGIAKSDRQQRHLSILTEFLHDAIFIRGADNVVADALSRAAYAIQHDFMDLASIARAQEGDTETQQHMEKLRGFQLPNNLTLYCDTSTAAPRPFVPYTCRQQVFTQLQSLTPGYQIIRPLSEITLRMASD